MRGAPTSSASVPASAAHTGEDGSKTLCAQPRAVQVTSKSRPCISRSASASDGSEARTPASARALSPSTVWQFYHMRPGTTFTLITQNVDGLSARGR
jgi:hypothetical protein